jgi:hypothetical protein
MGKALAVDADKARVLDLIASVAHSQQTSGQDELTLAVIWRGLLRRVRRRGEARGESGDEYDGLHQNRYFTAIAA